MPDLDPTLVVFSSLGVLIAIVTLRGIKKVSQGESAIVERLGRYHTTLTPGLNFIVPIIDKIRYVGTVNVSPHVSAYRIDVREQILDIPEQEVISADNIRMQVDTLVFFQIIEAHKAVYEISSPLIGIKQLAQTTIRNLFGEMEMDSSLSARESINTRLRTVLDDATDKWGIKIIRVEIQEIKPPEELKEAMQKQMIAERERRVRVTLAEADKRSKILEAEGFRQQKILEAEGESQSIILHAEAEKKRMIMEAEGESDSIRLVQEATASGMNAVREVLSKTGGNQGVILIEALRAQEEVAKALSSGSNSKIFLPNDLAGLFGVVGGIREILQLSNHISNGASENK